MEIRHRYLPTCPYIVCLIGPGTTLLFGHSANFTIIALRGCLALVGSFSLETKKGTLRRQIPPSRSTSFRPICLVCRHTDIGRRERKCEPSRDSPWLAELVLKATCLSLDLTSQDSVPDGCRISRLQRQLPPLKTCLPREGEKVEDMCPCAYIYMYVCMCSPAGGGGRLLTNHTAVD
ncbi:hypothetical protein B0H63DRAFT_459312 [Podospora didyma]|uniref:Uncharacterized protein n=1 Tax=Podospora didyma TaxID=330526 RepID=A0AAE0U7Z7_9PEZI|nr:hypothetical protein B0H63DRAFT_459312 [Podospora didyma]